MLAVEMNDLDSLRLCEDHAWNEFYGVVVDITATQFSSRIRGVYVGTPRSFHKNLVAKGLDAYREIIDWRAYRSEPEWPRLENYIRDL